MAEVPESGGGGKSKGKVRAKKQSTRIDMTPMVDLAFLLLTFFILTTTLAEQKTLDLIMPSEAEPENEDQGKVNNAITIILSGNDKVYYYEDELKTETVLNETNFKDIRNVLARKNKVVIEKVNDYYKKIKGQHVPDSLQKVELNKLRDDKRGAFVIIKYDSLARYRNAIDMVDEMEICAVPPGKYAIVKKLEPAEKVMLRFKYNK